MKKFIYFTFLFLTVIYNKLEIKADPFIDYDYHLEKLEVPTDIISELNDYQKQLIYERIDNHSIYESVQFLNVTFDKNRNVIVDDIDPDLRLINLSFKNTDNADNHEITKVFFYDWCKTNSLIHLLNEDLIVYNNYNIRNASYFQIIDFYGATYSKTKNHVKNLFETSAPTKIDLNSISFSSPSKYGLMPNSMIFGSFLLTYRVTEDSMDDGTFTYYHNYNHAAEYRELNLNHMTVKNNSKTTQNIKSLKNYVIFIALIGVIIYLSLTAKPRKK